VLVAHDQNLRSVKEEVYERGDGMGDNNLSKRGSVVTAGIMLENNMVMGME